jgi:hypothetical protein
MRCLLLLTLLLIPTVNAIAAPIIYTDKAAFESAAGQTLSIDLANPTSIEVNQSNYVIRVAFGDLVLFSSDVTGASHLTEKGVQLDGNGGALAILEPITGFGFDLDYFWELSRIRIWGVGDPYHEIGQPSIGFDIPEGTTFFGVLFHSPTIIGITSDVSNAAGVAGYAMSGLQLRTVPEPSTFLLLGLGMLAQFTTVRKLRKR